MRKIRQFQAHDRYRRKIQRFNNDTTKTTNRQRQKQLNSDRDKVKIITRSRLRIH